jgi:hypothetical protein
LDGAAGRSSSAASISRQAPGSDFSSSFSLMRWATLAWCACGGLVAGIEVNAVGGECEWEGRLTLFRCAVAWGGVMGQMLLFAIALGAWIVAHPVESRAGQDLLGALTSTNLLLMPINLLPVQPLDGARAWSVVGLGVRSLADRARGVRRRYAPRASLRVGRTKQRAKPSARRFEKTKR